MAISRHQGDITEGGMVTRLQTALKNRGFDIGTVDGRFGPGTESAVMRFQEANGLNADGIVGQVTWNALGLSGQVPAPVRID